MSRGGRGRGGKGRGSQLTFNVESIGLGRGEALPAAILQPPPFYPPLRSKPNFLEEGGIQTDLVETKQSILLSMQNSPYFIKPEIKTKDIQRYSDKYKINAYSDTTIGWQPDWRRFPSELKLNVSRRTNLSLKHNKKVKNADDVAKRLEKLEKQDAETNDDTKAKDGRESASDEEGAALEDTAQDEEIFEEENDYLTSYFDNGDEFMDEEDDEEKEGGAY